MPHPRSRDVFGIPGFPAYWAAYTVSGFGTYVTTIAVQVLVLVDLGGDAVDVGLLNAARWLPYLLLGLVAGALVDRRPRKPVLVGADLGRAVLLLVIPLLAVAGWLSLPALLVVVMAVGSLSLFGDAAAQSLVPRIVPRAQLLAAHARTDQSDAVAQTAGPVVAGGLVTLVGAAFSIVIDAASYLFSAIAIGRIRVEEAPAAPADRRPLRTEIAEGLRWVYRHRVLAPMAIGSHGWFFFTSMLGTVFTPFVLIGLHLSPFQLGVALAGAGVAALVGSTLSRRVGLRWGAGRAVIVSNLVMVLAWAVIATVPEPAPAWSLVALLTIGQGFYGFGLGLSNANEMGYRQAVTPDRLQARTNTTWRSANRGMIVVGAPLGGLLADALGFRPTLWIAIGGVALVTGFLALSPFRTARHQLPEPEAGA
ncbi:MFS transporter [Leifsonia sp. LS1]|uniref:MFS transporter n=1 Tax=Leifsonia sp. LS1 TaxID=2828483 RepID=UPI001CFD5085|nr:MFS transporter [Leifsonia sp. LS1]GIT81619.1 MFS transporter [Leifsonia sp. LS1]